MSPTLMTAAEAMQGVLHGQDAAFDGVSTDTRSVQAGELFFALSGPNFDGADFVAQAAAKGAAGAVIADQAASDFPQITVDDTRLALGRLGSAWRQQQAATVIGVTGSNGKTTLKEMIAACLSQIAPTIATAGNLNNEIGMPLMLLRIEESHQYAVIEMGANHGGEIAYLASLASPDVVVITNAGSAHLEGFGSLKGVAEGKGEILQGAKRPQCAVLNADDDYFEYWQTLVADVATLSFGLSETADVSAIDIEASADSTNFRLQLPGDSVAIRLPLVGIHNVRNACAAAAVAHALGIPASAVKTGLESVQPVDGRLQPVNGLHGATLYDDSYNANPVSVSAAGEFVASLEGAGWMVLGDMGELGDDALVMHKEVGAALRDAGIDRVFAVGELSKATIDGFGDGGKWFASMDELIEGVAGNLHADVNVLVKGSRSARMERAVEAFRATESMRKEA
ncbi:MAG: UDP-N-acetylmuramoyl-tripeptide--D-alanyl-D-alanine ligase [Woeseiaceae bacterium]